MKTTLVIDDNTIYEIDEECMCNKKRNSNDKNMDNKKMGNSSSDICKGRRDEKGNALDKNIHSAKKIISPIKRTGLNIGVAVLDTGIYPHKDFGDRIVAFEDIVNNKKEMYDDNGHGTHVAYLFGINLSCLEL